MIYSHHFIIYIYYHFIYPVIAQSQCLILIGRDSGLNTVSQLQAYLSPQDDTNVSGPLAISALKIRQSDYGISWYIPSVTRQKGESQNGCFKKTKHVKFISSPVICTCTCAYQGGRKCSFLGKFGVICFLETPVLRFALLP